MKSLIVVGILGLLLVGCVSINPFSNECQNNEIQTQKYQGPVPCGFDLEHFRKTGATIKEMVG